MPKKRKTRVSWGELKLGEFKHWNLYLSRHQMPYLGACYAVLKECGYDRWLDDLTREELSELFDEVNLAVGATVNSPLLVGTAFARLQIALPNALKYDGRPYALFVPRRSRKVTFDGLEFDERAFKEARGTCYVPKGIELDSTEILFKVRDTFRNCLRGSGIGLASA